MKTVIVRYKGKEETAQLIIECIQNEKGSV